VIEYPAERAENPMGVIDADPTIRFRKSCAIAHQSPGRDELTKSEDRGYCVVESQPSE
jgi:hypothetical protein